MRPWTPRRPQPVDDRMATGGERTFSGLPDFARWFLAQPIGALRPPKFATRQYSDDTRGSGAMLVNAFVLCRRPPYQVELFTGVGPGEFPQHSHPNVDSIEVMLCGEVGFIVDGKRMITDEMLATLAPDGALALCGTLFRVRPNQLHGAAVGPAGGAFFSIQKWLNGFEPTSVGLDWDGPAHTRVQG